jgi:hypothetical protein
MPLVFIFIFFGWALFRLFIKRDLKKNKDTLFIGFFFLAIWAVFYFLVFA